MGLAFPPGATSVWTHGGTIGTMRTIPPQTLLMGSALRVRMVSINSWWWRRRWITIPLGMGGLRGAFLFTEIGYEVQYNAWRLTHLQSRALLCSCRAKDDVGAYCLDLRFEVGGRVTSEDEVAWIQGHSRSFSSDVIQEEGLIIGRGVLVLILSLSKWHYMKEYDLWSRSSQNSHGGDSIAENECGIMVLHGKNVRTIYTYIEFGLSIMKRMVKERNLATKAPQIKENPKGR
jgi:hypothetical protein